MSGEFSLIDALEKLYLDPYPTKSFRTIVKYLKNIAVIVQHIHSVKICFIGDIVAKLTFTPKRMTNKMKTRLVPTAEIYKMLKRKQIPEKFASILETLFSYIVTKLNRCCSEDASCILSDFDPLLDSILTYKKYSVWDNSKVDEVVILFLMKLIKMVSEMKTDNRNEKFHLFSITRVIVMDFALCPVYTEVIIKQLNREICSYSQMVKQLPTKEEPYTCIHENFLTYLSILNDIIEKFISHKNKEHVTVIVSNLQKALDNVALVKMNPREEYLVESITDIIEVNLGI